MATLAQGCRQGACPGMGMLLTASVLCTALSACAQTEVWPSHHPLQHGTGSHEADELVQHRLLTKRHAHHQPLVEPVSHRDCPLQPLRALQQAPGPAGLPADVLMAAAFSYEPHMARAFLSTFRQHNQAARLILLVFPAQWHDLKDPFCEYHKRYGVEYYAVEASTYYTLSLWRFRAMHFILSGMTATELRNVLLVDLRDTIFQGNPFASMPASESAEGGERAAPYVLFTQEGDDHNNVTVGGNSFNRHWVEACFNHSVLQAISGGRVACSGTLLGGGGAVLAYLQLLFDVANFATKPGCLAMGGVDQGLHNYILHWLAPRRPDLLRFGMLVLGNEESPIYTVGSVQPHRMGGSGGLVVRTPRGRTPAVLHQVDRHADLVQHIEALSLDQLRRL